ncbi:hypothetical protein HAX54_001572 [Datura stramonium]|uniref:Peptidase A1 domain-containing protein n=1 Tax=Datura stramonium TaxID=4076 RepID=A0ABS8T405_DATST|nr:hypothetical protein [Datura stramonium]
MAFSQLALVSCTKSKTNHGLNGFTLDLIHRDSPLSPYYDPSITPSQRFRNACQRSFSRASFLKKASSVHPTGTTFNDGIQADISPMPGEYLMNISIGTPPRETIVIADTGSDLTWIQCKPCTQCFKQIAPLFDSQKSSTYKTVGCHSEACEMVRNKYCVRKDVCEYQVRYGDGSHSIGDIAFETFTFESTTSNTKNVDSISIPNVVFGCGHDNAGTFENQSTGIVGLGGSKISIIRQLDKQVQGRFSYCLTPVDLSPSSSPPNATSKIHFGRKAVVSGPDVITTPIIPTDPDIFYFLNLESISVGEKKLEFKSNSQLNSSATGGSPANMIIDSGTTLTYLPSQPYEKLESVLVESIKGKRKYDPRGEFGLCYESKTSVLDAPNIVFHFKDGDVELLPMNTFSEIEEGLTCLTIVDGGPRAKVGVYGNLAQMNFLIGYDLVNHKLSFLPTDCTNHSYI